MADRRYLSTLISLLNKGASSALSNSKSAPDAEAAFWMHDSFTFMTSCLHALCFFAIWDSSNHVSSGGLPESPPEPAASSAGS
eukprot:4046328-Pyramimonas_sp.AAC.1